MSVYLWTCPFCNRAATLNEDYDCSADVHKFTAPSRSGGDRETLALHSFVECCPNPQCKRFTLRTALFGTTMVRGVPQPNIEDSIQTWTLLPDGKAKPQPDYIPQPIRVDYAEACLIVEKSPKASATLARRALQGMIRDFWGVTAPNLFEEINAIKDKVDGETWEALHGLRDLGNIGAHMKRDINLIAEVDTNEASMLIELIETLFDDWYVARHDRQQRMASIKAFAASKRIATQPIDPEKP